MKVRQQSTAAMSHLAEILEGHRVAMLTINEPPTGLTSRPMTPLELDRDGAIWFMASRKTMLPLVKKDQGPELVNLAFVRHDASDYVSLAGEAELIDDVQRKHELWMLAGRPWFDGPTDPDLVLLRIKPRRAEIWDGPDSRAIRVLAMAASVVAGRQMGLGHKETLNLPSQR